MAFAGPPPRAADGRVNAYWLGGAGGAARTRILVDILIATSVHIPKTLLEAVDRRARALRISRNRLIVRALERELGGEGGWSAGFFESLAATDQATADAADEMLASIRAARSSKKAPRL